MTFVVGVFPYSTNDKAGIGGPPYRYVFFFKLHFLDAVNEGLQLAAAAGVTELA